MENLDKLKELNELLDKGSITKEEYEKLKLELLGNTKKPLGQKNISFKTGCLTILGIFIGLPMLVAIMSPEDKPTSSSRPSQEQTSPPQVTKVNLNTYANVKSDRAVKVTSFKVVDNLRVNNQFADPIESKGGKLVLVYLNIKNTGNSSGDMFWSDYKLVDSQGRQYDTLEDFGELITLSTYEKEQGLSDSGDQLFPGAEAKVVKVFRVSPDATGFTLSSGNITFTLE